MPERIVEVEWEDSCGADRWLTEDDRDEFFAQPPLLLHTVGFVVRDDEQALGLAEAVPANPSPGKQWGSCIIIPRSAIRKITELARRRTHGKQSSDR